MGRKRRGGGLVLQIFRRNLDLNNNKQIPMTHKLHNFPEPSCLSVVGWSVCHNYLKRLISWFSPLIFCMLSSQDLSQNVRLTWKRLKKLIFSLRLVTFSSLEVIMNRYMIHTRVAKARGLEMARRGRGGWANGREKKTRGWRGIAKIVHWCELRGCKFGG